MISTKDLTTQGEQKEFVSKYLRFGFNFAAIEGFSIRTASTGKVQLSFHMEAPSEDPNFDGAAWWQDNGEPEVKAKGMYSKVNMGIYMEPTDEVKLQRVVRNLGAIASAIGKRKEVDAIEASTLEDYMEKYLKVVKGIPFWSKFKAREYNVGKFNLTFAEYKATDDEWYIVVKGKDEVSGLNVIKEEPLKQELVYQKDGETKKFVFDKSSKWDYEPVEDSDSGDSIEAELEDDTI